VPVWNALKQAELDDRAFKSQTMPITARRWAFAVLLGFGIALSLLIHSLLSSSIQNLKNLRNAEGVFAIQSRLAQLGYISGKSTVVWYATSHDALGNFETARKLTREDTWDSQTQQTLGSGHAVTLQQSFIGVWSQTSECTSHPTLAIEVLGARSAVYICEFLSISSDWAGWHARSRCTFQEVTIEFTTSPDKLIWDEERFLGVRQRNLGES
jgi:hypothetical protein